ncbi:MAG: hypothetical protein NTV05_05720 [Acidobacteria bacterium]|nr:hypothetical protein [Acidobacteriota bacterium]
MSLGVRGGREPANRDPGAPSGGTAGIHPRIVPECQGQQEVECGREILRASDSLFVPDELVATEVKDGLGAEVSGNPMMMALTLRAFKHRNPKQIERRPRISRGNDWLIQRLAGNAETSREAVGFEVRRFGSRVAQGCGSSSARKYETAVRGL